jgi:hypothetical protein
MLENWMDVYVIIFVLGGLGVAFVSQLEILRGHKKTPQEDKLPQERRNAFSWFGFFSLNLVALLMPIFAYISKTVPNNPLPELIFCFYFVSGPLLISQWLVVNKETGRLAVSLPYFQGIWFICCWFFPWKLWKTGFNGPAIFMVFPFFLAYLAGVSPVLIGSVIIPMIIFSWVIDVARVHD